MATWTNTALVGIRDSTAAVTYYFAPNELVYGGRPLVSPRQKISKAESGLIKVAETGDDETIYEFFVNRMPSASRTVGALTIGGETQLALMVTGFGDYSLNTLSIKLPGATAWNVVRFVGPFPYHVPHVSAIGGENRFGDGSTAIQFRLDT